MIRLKNFGNVTRICHELSHAEARRTWNIFLTPLLQPLISTGTKDLCVWRIYTRVESMLVRMHPTRLPENQVLAKTSITQALIIHSKGLVFVESHVLPPKGLP